MCGSRVRKQPARVISNQLRAAAGGQPGVACVYVCGGSSEWPDGTARFSQSLPTVGKGPGHFNGPSIFIKSGIVFKMATWIGKAACWKHCDPKVFRNKSLTKTQSTIPSLVFALSTGVACLLCPSQPGNCPWGGVPLHLVSQRAEKWARWPCQSGQSRSSRARALHCQASPVGHSVPSF